MDGVITTPERTNQDTHSPSPLNSSPWTSKRVDDVLRSYGLLRFNDDNYSSAAVNKLSSSFENTRSHPPARNSKDEDEDDICHDSDSRGQVSSPPSSATARRLSGRNANYRELTVDLRDEFKLHQTVKSYEHIHGTPDAAVAVVRDLNQKSYVSKVNGVGSSLFVCASEQAPSIKRAQISPLSNSTVGGGCSVSASSTTDTFTVTTSNSGSYFRGGGVGDGVGSRGERSVGSGTKKEEINDMFQAVRNWQKSATKVPSSAMKKSSRWSTSTSSDVKNRKSKATISPYAATYMGVFKDRNDDKDNNGSDEYGNEQSTSNSNVSQSMMMNEVRSLTSTINCDDTSQRRRKETNNDDELRAYIFTTDDYDNENRSSVESILYGDESSEGRSISFQGPLVVDGKGNDRKIENKQNDKDSERFRTSNDCTVNIIRNLEHKLKLQREANQTLSHTYDLLKKDYLRVLERVRHLEEKNDMLTRNLVHHDQVN